MLVTNGSGAAVDNHGYYAYGRDRRGSELRTAQGFTGHLTDGTGLIYMNARSYDPQLGQFISPDTLVPDATQLMDFNRYAYARGNPMKYNDPTGHVSSAIHDSDGGTIPEWLKQLGDHWADLYANDPTKLGPEIRLYLEGLKGGFTEFQSTGKLLEIYYGQTNGGIIAEYQNTFANAWAGGELQTAWHLTGGWSADSSAALLAGSVVAAAGLSDAGTDIREGSFSIIDWRGYPEDLPRPRGPFRTLAGEEYRQARRTADVTNVRLRDELDLVGQAVDIHEIHPVKLGGSPTDPGNKVIIVRRFHQTQVTPWWQKVINYATGN